MPGSRSSLLGLSLLMAACSGALSFHTPPGALRSHVAHGTAGLPQPARRGLVGPALQLRSVASGAPSGGGASLAEQAEKAKREAEEAEQRALSAKRTVEEMRAATAAAAPAPKAVEVEEVPLMDEDELAREMSELLGGLQSRGGGGGKKEDPLAGTRWELTLDFGREKGTWMDAKWGASGQRVKRGLAFEFGSDGKVRPIESHSFGLLPTLQGIEGGEWRVEGEFPGEKVKFWVDHKGFTSDETGCDIGIEAGRLFLSANTMGGSFGRGGGLSIEQFRFYVRRERRMVGVFTHKQIKE